MAKEKLYVGTKIVVAVSMDKNAFLETEKGEKPEGRRTETGYKVTYPDGYVSWSPTKTFEAAYREVIPGEIALEAKDTGKLKGKPERAKK